jgi:hypothetical protein
LRRRGPFLLFDDTLYTASQVGIAHYLEDGSSLLPLQPWRLSLQPSACRIPPRRRLCGMIRER